MGDETKRRREGRGPGDILPAPLVHFFFFCFFLIFNKTNYPSMNRLYTQRRGTAHHPHHPQQQCKCSYDKRDGDGDGDRDATMRPCDNDGREGCTGDRARESSPAPCSKVFFNNYIRFFTLLTSFYYTGTMTGL
jgi:hypothetical protein